MEGSVDLGATQWFWTQNPWIRNRDKFFSNKIKLLEFYFLFLQTSLFIKSISVFWPVWCLCLKFSVALLLVSEFLIFCTFFEYANAGYHKAKTSLWKRLKTFSTIPALVWILVTIYNIEFTSWKTIIQYSYVDLYAHLLTQLYFLWSTWHVMFSQTKFQIGINICHVMIFSVSLNSATLI